MATRGRPRSPSGPTTATDRKREFDRRMRNADGQVKGEPARTPVVLYLSAEAREVIRRHREDAALAGAPPLLDSQLVEALLLAFHSHRLLDAPASVEAAATSTSKATVRPAKDDEIKRLRELRAKIRRLNSKLERYDDDWKTSPVQWFTVLDSMIDRHREEESRLMHPLAQRLHGTLGKLPSDAARMRAVSDEVIDYLETLLDLL